MIIRGSDEEKKEREESIRSRAGRENRVKRNYKGRGGGRRDEIEFGQREKNEEIERRTREREWRVKFSILLSVKNERGGENAERKFFGMNVGIEAASFIGMIR